MEEAHKVVTSTASPPANNTTPSSLQLNMHMLGRTNQTSSSKHEEAAAKQSRGQAAVDVRGSSGRGGLDPVRGGRRGARNRAAVRSGGRGLGSRLLRNRSDFCQFPPNFSAGCCLDICLPIEKSKNLPHNLQGIYEIAWE